MLLWRSGDLDEPPLRWLLAAAGVLGITYGTLALAVRPFARGGRKGLGTPAEVPPLAPDEKLIKCRRFE